MSVKRTVAVVLVVLTLGGGAARAQQIQVTPLARDHHLMVSFEQPEAFNDDIRAAIRSGLATSFTYDVELRRGSVVWFDRTMASARVSVRVRYDNLTRRYQLSRSQDGRAEETTVTEDEAAVRKWLTVFDRLPLFSTDLLEPNSEYHVRVRSRTRPRNILFFLPWDRDSATGSATFTFIP